MINIYTFIEECKNQGLSASEALEELHAAEAEAKEAFFEDYYSRPDVCAGWAQQDVIDMYRRER